jgi:hypothetical protein
VGTYGGSGGLRQWNLRLGDGARPAASNGGRLVAYASGGSEAHAMRGACLFHRRSRETFLRD